MGEDCALERFELFCLISCASSVYDFAISFLLVVGEWRRLGVRRHWEEIQQILSSTEPQTIFIFLLSVFFFIFRLNIHCFISFFFIVVMYV